MTLKNILDGMSVSKESDDAIDQLFSDGLPRTSAKSNSDIRGDSPESDGGDLDYAQIGQDVGDFIFSYLHGDITAAQITSDALTHWLFNKVPAAFASPKLKSNPVAMLASNLLLNSKLTPTMTQFIAGVCNSAVKKTEGSK